MQEYFGIAVEYVTMSSTSLQDNLSSSHFKSPSVRAVSCNDVFDIITRSTVRGGEGMNGADKKGIVNSILLR